MTTTEITAGAVVEDSYGNPAVVLTVPVFTEGQSDQLIWGQISVLQLVGSDRGRIARAGGIRRVITGDRSDWAQAQGREIWPSLHKNFRAAVKNNAGSSVQVEAEVTK